MSEEKRNDIKCQYCNEMFNIEEDAILISTNRVGKEQTGRYFTALKCPKCLSIVSGNFT